MEETDGESSDVDPQPSRSSDVDPQSDIPDYLGDTSRRIGDSQGYSADDPEGTGDSQGYRVDRQVSSGAIPDYRGDAVAANGDSRGYPFSDRDAIAGCDVSPEADTGTEPDAELQEAARTLGIRLDPGMVRLLREEEDLSVIAAALDARRTDASRSLAPGLIERPPRNSSRRADPQVCLRLGGGAYSALSRVALANGVAPTTMARMLLRKALAEAVATTRAAG